MAGLWDDSDIVLLGALIELSTAKAGAKKSTRELALILLCCRLAHGRRIGSEVESDLNADTLADLIDEYVDAGLNYVETAAAALLLASFDWPAEDEQSTAELHRIVANLRSHTLHYTAIKLFDAFEELEAAERRAASAEAAAAQWHRIAASYQDRD